MKRVIVCFLAFMLIPSIALCATVTVPDQDTALHPQGWIAGGILKFKPGSQAEVNERGEVISGILKFNEWLRSVGRWGGFARGSGTSSESTSFICFKGYDAVTTFDERGRVISGTLVEGSAIYLIPDTDPSIAFKGNTVIVFDRNGNVVSGTLDKDTFLRPAGWGKFLPANASLIKFKAATEIVFGPNAQVLKGTLVNDLSVNGITLPAGTTLQFSESSYPQRI